jgi:hypothetical protein
MPVVVIVGLAVGLPQTFRNHFPFFFGPAHDVEAQGPVAMF